MLQKNISSTISSHNWRIFKSPNNEHGCNCRDRNSYPLNNKCLTPKVVYQADVSASTRVEKTYFGLSEATFKERYRNHVYDFKHRKCETSTGFSEYIWRLKYESLLPAVKWKLFSKFNSTLKRVYCKLCLTEGYWTINCFGNENVLNKKSELISKCRLKTKGKEKVEYHQKENEMS